MLKLDCFERAVVIFFIIVLVLVGIELYKTNSIFDYIFLIIMFLLFLCFIYEKNKK